MCALYVRCTLFVLQKECRKVWGAHYMLGARYRSENTVHGFTSEMIVNLHSHHCENSNIQYMIKTGRHFNPLALKVDCS